MREVRSRRTFLVCIAAIVFVWGVPFGECCAGPGRGGGRRRSPRKLTPLVFKQHVPNVAENTLGASGLTEGRISREDPRFHHLVPNYNSDILFSDEEGTGADRLMTERCKEKVNTLAISVMNQWPGVRLRVVEAWDEGALHAPHSLHYEGRAVDVTTSDKDFSKHGMLARLAVQAGFDWVYYESRSRIHCSVKSESSSRRKLGGCFPGHARVETPGGRIPLDRIREGDAVKVLRSDGTFAYSPVLMFLHRDARAQRVFLTLVTSSGTSVSLTPSHLVFLLRGNSAPPAPSLRDALALGEVVLAGRVTAGDYLLVDYPTGGVVLEKVVGMGALKAEGVFAPLTAEGTLVVEGVVASCYAVIDSQSIAHWAFLPARFYFRVRDSLLSLLRGLGLFSGAVTDQPREGETKNLTRSFASDNYLNNNIEDSDYISDNKYDSKIAVSKSLKSPQEAIHWYPKMLYSIASTILPSHMVYS